MLSNENNTSTSGEARRYRPLPVLEIDTAKLAEMSPYELWALRGGVHAVGAILAGMLCQPRYGEKNYNLAGDLMSGISEWLSFLETAVVDDAKARAAVPDAQATEWLGWLIVQYEADMTDDLTDLAVVVAEAARNQARAIFAEGHK